MAENFNTYIDNIEPDFWRGLCTSRGELLSFPRGAEFVSAGKPGRYVGYIKSGTLKYVAPAADGTVGGDSGHVVGLEFAGEFVCDFPFSLYGQRSRVSIIAESDCEIYCVPAADIRRMMDSDPRLKDIVMKSTEAIFATVYDRYIELYTDSPARRYERLISRHPDLFAMFSLKDIASFLNITPTHLSRLRRNI